VNPNGRRSTDVHWYGPEFALNAIREFPLPGPDEEDGTVDQNKDVAARVDDNQSAIVDLLLLIARALADFPEDVQVQFVSDDDGTAFEIRANDADLGTLIGKKGQTARAIESIVNSNRRKSGRHYHLEIVGIGESREG
jgi:uncharacterized protein